MKKLIILLLIMPFTYQVMAGDSPNKLMKRAYQAILDQDAQKLQEYLIADANRTPEIRQAVAELIIAVHSGKVKAFDEKYKAEKEKQVTRPLSPFIRSLLYIKEIPPFDHSAKKGEFKADKNRYYVTYEDQDRGERTYAFDLKETDEGWKFWPRKIFARNDWITNRDVLNEYWAIFETQPREQYADALNKLIRKYVEPTDMDFADQPITGKIENQVWNVKKGVALKQGNNIRLILSDSVSTEDKCPIWLFGNKVGARIAGPGEYDLALTEATITLEGVSTRNLIDKAKITLEVDESAKIAKGQVVARFDDKNYVNGTFEVPWCIR